VSPQPRVSLAAVRAQQIADAAASAPPGEDDQGPALESVPPTAGAPAQAAAPALNPMPASAQIAVMPAVATPATEAVPASGLLPRISFTSILAACDDAKMSRRWVMYSVKMPDPLRARLTGLMLEHREATGDYRLALNHYQNVAFAQIPADVREAAAWGVMWRDQQELRLTDAPGSGTKLHGDVVESMRQLGGRLRTLESRVWLWEIQAAAIERLLSQLDPPGRQPVQ